MEDIGEKINQTVSKLAGYEAEFSGIDTRHLTLSLAQSNALNDDLTGKLDFLISKVSLSRRPYLTYKPSGVPNGKERISGGNWVNLIGLILLRACLALPNNEDEGSRIRILRSANALLKLNDQEAFEWLQPDQNFRQQFEVAWKTDPHAFHAYDADKISWNSPNRATAGKILPITVMFYEGPIGRAYLATFESLGFKPERIINLISEKDLISKKKSGRFLPQIMRQQYAAKSQARKIHYWANKLSNSHAPQLSQIQSSISTYWRFEQNTLTSATQIRPLSHYSDTVQSIMIDGLKDYRLSEALKQNNEQSVLFTGGGIVPKRLFQKNMPRLIHIHPGHLPQIRGADCLLWSNLLFSHTAASALYMNQGIDMGDVIKTACLPQLPLTGFDSLDSQSLYRMAYAFIDPWLRAFLLREILLEFETFDDLLSKPQTEDDGITFYFMTQQFRQRGFNFLFCRTVEDHL